ncbi:MAG: aminoacyl-histidine dipeptidase [Candidatus Eisenbacteria bacterium]
MSDHALAGLEPALLWKYFAELSRIPRESKKERAAGDWVVKVAGELGLEHARDKAGNVVVRKPASPGREHLPMVCLQSHLDMVCVKVEGKKHDFARDPIALQVVDGWVTADGTTLGADNGIAVATNLAIAADRSLEHGPLEFLFTVDEETGLTGAAELDPELLRSRILINLDSEEEGFLTVGCAGGTDSSGTWALATDPAKAGSVAIDVRVTGLKGGHSGVEIHTQRGNANKLLARIIAELVPLDARIVKLEGGAKRNSIPAVATARLALPKARLEDARGIVGCMREVMKAELDAIEPGLEVTLDVVKGKPGKVWKRSLQKNILRVLLGLPHGVLKMSPAIPGLVETSTNVAVMTQTAKAWVLDTSQRSLVESERVEAANATRAVLELGGATVKPSNGYPGWKPDLSSRILAVSVRVHENMFGRKPEVVAIHAGLECGLIGRKYPGMDMVSLGPNITGAHSPQEKVEIASVAKYWNYLLAILGEVA